LPYRGDIFKDQDIEALTDGIASDVAMHIEAALAGKRDGANHKSAVRRIITPHCLKYMVTIYECEACGRLWVQRSTKSQEFASYIPELPETKGILKSEHAP